MSNIEILAIFFSPNGKELNQHKPKLTNAETNQNIPEYVKSKITKNPNLYPKSTKNQIKKWTWL